MYLFLFLYLSKIKTNNIMKANNFSFSQQKGLLEMLTNQVRPKTETEQNLFIELQQIVFRKLEKVKSKSKNELKMLASLRSLFIEECDTVEFGKNTFERSGKYVRQIHMDTFGERYNNCWIKLRETPSGELFFYSSYIGKQRIYLA